MRHKSILLLFLIWAISPLRAQNLPVEEAFSDFQPFTILSPLPDTAIISSGDALEISLLFDGVAGLEIKLFLDGADITANSQITDDYLFFLSPEPAVKGSHNITILALSEPDTLFSQSWSFSIDSADTPPESFKIPTDVFLTAGIFYSACNKDSSGLGLSYPIGYHPSGDLNVSGPLASGFFNSYLSYDPNYDKYIHGLFQFAQQRFNISVGEFFPDLSALVFSGASPLGLLATYQKQSFQAQITACRTLPADTLFQTFAQYLYGGQLKKSIADSVRLSGGYLYGYDVPRSLPDSIRYKSTSFIYNDTLTGLADTIITIDTLFSGRNRLYWFSAQAPLKEVSLYSEYAYSGFQPDSSQLFVNDYSYLMGIKRSTKIHSFDIHYISWGSHFKSFGNPYLESAKNEFIWSADSKWSGRFFTRIDGAIYKVLTDSSLGNSFKTGISLSYSQQKSSTTYLRFDYNYRPYLSYLYQNRSISIYINQKLGKFSVFPNYSYSSSSSSCLTQSHAAGFGVLRYLLSDKLFLSFSYQLYRIFDDHQITDQQKGTTEFKTSWQISNINTINASYRYIKKDDYLDSLKSYKQQILSLSVSHRF